MELPCDIWMQIMLLLDDKSLRRVATTIKQTKNIYDKHFKTSLFDSIVVNPFWCDIFGHSSFSRALAFNDIALAKQYMIDNNIDAYEDLKAIITYTNAEFYKYIGVNICYIESTSNLNKFLGLNYDDLNAHFLFGIVLNLYEMMELDGDFMMEYNDIIQINGHDTWDRYERYKESIYLNDYLLPPRELHDNDRYIYKDLPITKEVLDHELDDYFSQ